MIEQFKTIRAALRCIPAKQASKRHAALKALSILAAIIHVQDVRILQLNNMIPLDEVGNPATQEYIDALLSRPRNH